MINHAARAAGDADSRRGVVADQLRAFKAELFKALAHPSRIKILDLLRDQTHTVSELQAHLGIEPSSVSQQLAVLRANHLVDGRREGTNVYYSVRDPQIFALLDAARVIFDNHLITLQAMASGAPDLASERDSG